MRKFWSISIPLVLYVAVLLVINLIHFRFFPVRVVLYDTLLDVLVAAIATFVVCYLLRRRLDLSPAEGALMFLLCLAVGYNFAISIPTVIDRSLSIYILEKLAQRGGAIRYSAFGDIFKTEYFNEDRLLDIRMTEQLNSGTIVIDNGCVRLTPRGARIAEITRYYRMHILPKRREIMGVFTDALTDPFRNAPQLVESKCQ